KAAKSDIPPIQPVDPTQLQRLPLSFAQERVWFFEQLEPGTAVYNLPRAVSIRGELNLDQLEHACNLIIARHENLRTIFPSRHGQVQQVILESLNFKLQRIDLSHYQTKEQREARAKEICQTDV